METITNICIDLSYLHSVSGGDANFEKTLLTSAVNDIQNNISKIKQAWLSEDAAEVSKLAHSLKSVMVIAGLPQFENACKKLDSIFRDGVFRPEEAGTISYITSGWAEAKPKLEELISMY